MLELVQAPRHRWAGVIGAVVVACALSAASPAHAIPAVSCGNLEVSHKRYAIRAHVLSCRTARRWSVAFLLHGTVPTGYECERYSPKVTRVRFLCDDPQTTTRIDGPLSFNATA